MNTANNLQNNAYNTGFIVSHISSRCVDFSSENSQKWHYCLENSSTLSHITDSAEFEETWGNYIK